jgi:hypothetical protein
LRIRYRSATGTVFDALASIGSGTSFTVAELLAPAIVVFAATAFIVLFALFYFTLWKMEEGELNSMLGFGEPMLVDGLEEQGLPFPHVVGEDGKHTVQLIDM